MYSTQAYLYQQKTQVLLLLDNCGQYFTLRYNPVYAKKLTLNLGVDNTLLFSFINPEEKPVNVTGATFIFRLLNQNGTSILLEQEMQILHAATGQVKVAIPASALLEIQAQPASYSITCLRGGLNQPAFVDANAGARGDIDIVSSVFPRFVPSAPLTIPTIKLSAQASTDGAGYQNYPDWAGGGAYWNGSGNGGFWNSYTNTEFYSSFIEPRSALTTIQLTLVGYTGTIKVQAAENYESIWYNVSESTTYYNEYRTIHLNVAGWHPLLRLAFNNAVVSTPTPPGIPALAYAVCTEGVLTSMEVQNGGSGYLAPPKINILGDGAGATAEAIMSNTYPEGHPQAGIGYGSIQSINVTNGGSGYWPMPYGMVNAVNYPVPPANQGAWAAITTGYAVDLLYR